MPEVVEGLSGTEIIEDALNQVRKRLQSDCSLRDVDCYGGGYSGKVTISLKMFAMDVTEVNMEVDLHPSPALIAAASQIPPDAPGTEIEVKQEIEIPLEENLLDVRERMQETSIPDPSEAPEPKATPITVPRRSYKRTGTESLEQTATGGAVNIDDSF